MSKNESKNMMAESLGINKVTVSVQRYNELLEAEAFLNKLFAAGVDSWEGYEVAVEMDD